MRRISPTLPPILVLLLALLLAVAVTATAGGCTSDTTAGDSDSAVTSDGAGRSADGSGAESADDDATEDTLYGDEEPDDNAPAGLELTADDDGGALTVKKGGTITLTLAENPSTGAMWEMQLDDPEASLIEQLAEPSFAPDDPAAEDAGGMTTFSFKAVDAGEMVIRLVLIPADAGEPDDTFEITLTVR